MLLKSVKNIALIITGFEFWGVSLSFLLLGAFWFYYFRLEMIDYNNEEYDFFLCINSVLLKQIYKIESWPDLNV